MKRRGFLKFLGMSPLVPLALKIKPTEEPLEYVAHRKPMSIEEIMNNNTDRYEVIERGHGLGLFYVGEPTEKPLITL